MGIANHSSRNSQHNSGSNSNVVIDLTQDDNEPGNVVTTTTTTTTTSNFVQRNVNNQRNVVVDLEPIEIGEDLAHNHSQTTSNEPIVNLTSEDERMLKEGETNSETGNFSSDGDNDETSFFDLLQEHCEHDLTPPSSSQSSTNESSNIGMLKNEEDSHLDEDELDVLPLNRIAARGMQRRRTASLRSRRL